MYRASDFHQHRTTDSEKKNLRIDGPFLPKTVIPCWYVPSDPVEVHNRQPEQKITRLSWTTNISTRQGFPILPQHISFKDVPAELYTLSPNTLMGGAAPNHHSTASTHTTRYMSSERSKPLEGGGRRHDQPQLQTRGSCSCYCCSHYSNSMDTISSINPVNVYRVHCTHVLQPNIESQ